MCNLPGRLFRRTFSAGTGHAGSADCRGAGTDRSGLGRIFLSLEENKGKIAFFGGINKCRFKGKVKPGDKLRLETKIIRRKGPLGVGEATATVDGKVVASGELTFMVGDAE